MSVSEAQTSQVEADFRKAAIILACAAIGTYLLQFAAGLVVMRFFDLQCALLSLVLLAVNFRSWAALSEFLTGRGRSIQPFLTLKLLSLILLVLLLGLSGARGLIVFLISLTVFLFTGSFLALRSHRR